MLMVQDLSCVCRIDPAHTGSILHICITRHTFVYHDIHLYITIYNEIRTGPDQLTTIVVQGDKLREIMNTDFGADIRPLRAQRAGFETAAEPLNANMKQHVYTVKDPVVAQQMAASEIHYESCGLASLICQMLGDERIHSHMHFKFEPKVDPTTKERVFKEFYTADAFKEMSRGCPEGCFPLGIVLYQDETWLTKSGSASDKPLVMSFANLDQPTYNQVYRIDPDIFFLLSESFLYSSPRILQNAWYCTIEILHP